MQLISLTAADEELAVRLECDPEMMHFIGGPRSAADVRASHKRRLALIDQGEAEMYKIVASDVHDTLGTIGFWKIAWKGPGRWETGWFVLPEYQGQGIATRAGHLLLAQARSNPAVAFVHAFPAVENHASNKVAHNLGMKNMGEFDNEGFAGVLRCYDWRVDVRESHQQRLCAAA